MSALWCDCCSVTKWVTITSALSRTESYCLYGLLLLRPRYCMSRTNQSSSSHRCLYRHQSCFITNILVQIKFQRHNLSEYFSEFDIFPGRSTFEGDKYFFCVKISILHIKTWIYWRNKLHNWFCFWQIVFMDTCTHLKSWCKLYVCSDSV